MKIYFAGSIRGGRGDKDLYLHIIKLLQKYGEVLTEHVGDQTLSALGEDGSNDQYIYTRDMAWLNEADIIIAEVTTASLGVGYEIAKAQEWHKRILCIYRQKEGTRVSAMIAGSPGLPIERYFELKDLRNIFDKFFISSSDKISL